VLQVLEARKPRSALLAGRRRRAFCFSSWRVHPALAVWIVASGHASVHQRARRERHVRPTSPCRPDGLLKGRLEHVQDQTARSCSEVMRFSGLQHPLASFSFICATYYGISGEHGMSMMAEKLSEALGWIPSLGIVGGPEFGTTASSTVTGGFTTSSIIFGAELNGLDEANAFMHVS